MTDPTHCTCLSSALLARVHISCQVRAACFATCCHPASLDKQTELSDTHRHAVQADTQARLYNNTNA